MLQRGRHEDDAEIGYDEGGFIFSNYLKFSKKIMEARQLISIGVDLVHDEVQGPSEVVSLIERSIYQQEGGEIFQKIFPSHVEKGKYEFLIEAGKENNAKEWIDFLFHRIFHSVIAIKIRGHISVSWKNNQDVDGDMIYLGPDFVEFEDEIARVLGEAGVCLEWFSIQVSTVEEAATTES
jgi:hypothetical protein